MLSDLLTKMKSYNPHVNVDRVGEAYHLSEQAHEGQLRSSGEPYFIHPEAVAMILADLSMDDDTIIAGLLHDAIEDTVMTFEELEEKFGISVAEIVDGVTKLKKIKYKSKKENQAENLRKMVLAMAKDIRVVIIKLADRLHNMRTLEYMTRVKQIEKATETIEIYAPLASRLGINTIKWELEDLSLRYLEPEKYYDLVNKIQKNRAEREEGIQGIIEILNVALDELNIHGEINGRPKSIFSIYKKMYQQKKSFEEIFDLSAVRVIVNTVNDCYGVLGAVHTLWKPIPGRFKDYIAMPKANMYQSLHTTVIGPQGEIFEVQIRTWEMHKTAEYGIAAHWKYKDGNTTKSHSNFDDKLTWIRQLMDWQRDISDSREFIDIFKEEFSTDEVFVFSPHGDVMDLPEGSTPIDFAYRVHSDVGNHCVGAKVDGRLVPLNYKLRNGNIVEILTSQNSSGPSQDWLKIVKSSQAKTKIKQFFKKVQKSQNIERGRDALEREARKLGYPFNEFFREDWLKEISERMSYSSIEDLYAAIGFGTISVNQVIPKLNELYQKHHKFEKTLEQFNHLESKDLENEKRKRISANGIIVEGVDNLEIKLAKCCNPVPGDDIVGYITKGRGISVHRQDCSNLINLEDEDRLIDVQWDNTDGTTYLVEIKIIAFDRPDYLATVTQKLTEKNFNVIGMNARRDKDKTYIINLTVEITNTSQVKELIGTVLSIKGTLDVYRVKS